MPPPRARLKSTAEDFVVDEVPAYAASGAGDHLYVRFEKRLRTTNDAVAELARHAGVDVRDVGVPGLKDKVAVTTQWISLPAGPGGDRQARLEGFASEGLRVLELGRHGNKLRTGHLAANRFRIRLRGLDPAAVDGVCAALERLPTEGVPNAFGPQRFGRDGENPARALAFLRGDARPPRDGRLRRLLFSALQADIFNRVLAARREDGTWATPIEGDLLKLEAGGMFLSTDTATDRARAARGEVTPTGPIVGAKMRAPAGLAAALEAKVAREVLGDGVDLAAARALGEGTRRTLVLRPRDLVVTREPTSAEQGANLLVEFMLPRGAYATTVLSCAVELDGPEDRDRDREREDE